MFAPVLSTAIDGFVPTVTVNNCVSLYAPVELLNVSLYTALPLPVVTTYALRDESKAIPAAFVSVDPKFVTSPATRAVCADTPPTINNAHRIENSHLPPPLIPAHALPTMPCASSRTAVALVTSVKFSLPIVAIMEHRVFIEAMPLSVAKFRNGKSIALRLVVVPRPPRLPRNHLETPAPAAARRA